MLINGSSLQNRAILSLHVGGKIAEVIEPIIDPNDLSLIAFRVEGPLVRGDVGDILPIESVREFSRQGIIVDSIDELVDGDEIVRLRDILKLRFSLQGIKVVTCKKTKLGKVSDYTIDTTTWSVRQLIVRRPVMKSLIDPELVISRQSIVEISDYYITVKDEHEKAKNKSSITENREFIPNFINPFREPDFAAENSAEAKNSSK